MRRNADLDAALRGAPVPEEAAARERGWSVVAAAFAEREPRRRRPIPGVAAVVVVVLVAALAVALTPPGDAIGDWLRAIVRAEPTVHRHSAVLGPLPGHTRLLAVARTGAWIVAGDGARRRLGAYDAAAMSPHGLFVAAARGRLLAAVDLRGRVRWTLTGPRRVSGPVWSPDGFRVGYRSGSEVRVVYGDGARDRRLARRSAAVTPAWRPGLGHRLAYVDRRGRVTLRDADSGRVLWRAATRPGARRLAWAPDGRRLLAVASGAVRVLTAGGRTARVLRMPAGSRAVGVAWLPDGRRFALLRARRGESDVLLVALRGAGRDGSSGRPARRRLLAVPGRLADVLAAPDGRRLLLSAPDADQWLLIRTAGGGRLTALDGVGRQFDPGGRGPAAPPRPVAWIR